MKIILAFLITVALILVITPETLRESAEAFAESQEFSEAQRKGNQITTEATEIITEAWKYLAGENEEE